MERPWKNLYLSLAAEPRVPRWKYEYDEIIIKHMESIAVVRAYKKRLKKMKNSEIYHLGTRDIDFVDGKETIRLIQDPQSIADIHRAIRHAGYLDIHRETVSAHLDYLEKKQFMTKLPKGNVQCNPTQYVLSKAYLGMCLDLLPPTMYEFIEELGTLRRILYALGLE